MQQGMYVLIPKDKSRNIAVENIDYSSSCQGLEALIIPDTFKA